MIQKVDVRTFHLSRDYNNNLVSKVKARRNKNALVAGEQDNIAINYRAIFV